MVQSMIFLYNGRDWRGRIVACFFVYDHRLGISLPELENPWEEYPEHSQETILSQWENIRGTIPDRIKEVEHEIDDKQEQLNIEEDFEKSCRINSDIAELASIINDLWIWYRTQNQISGKRHL